MSDSAITWLKAWASDIGVTLTSLSTRASVCACSGHDVKLNHSSRRTWRDVSWTRSASTTRSRSSLPSRLCSARIRISSRLWPAQNIMAYSSAKWLRYQSNTQYWYWIFKVSKYRLTTWWFVFNLIHAFNFLDLFFSKYSSSFGLYRLSSIEYRVSSIEYRVSSIEYRVSSIRTVAVGGVGLWRMSKNTSVKWSMELKGATQWPKWEDTQTKWSMGHQLALLLID